MLDKQTDRSIDRYPDRQAGRETNSEVALCCLHRCLKWCEGGSCAFPSEQERREAIYRQSVCLMGRNGTRAVFVCRHCWPTRASWPHAMSAQFLSLTPLYHSCVLPWSISWCPSLIYYNSQTVVTTQALHNQYEYWSWMHQEYFCRSLIQDSWTTGRKMFSLGHSSHLSLHSAGKINFNICIWLWPFAIV